MKRTIRRLMAGSPTARRVFVRLIPVWERYVELTAPCVFIHLRKTAGTSISRAIGLKGTSHSSAEEWFAHIGPRRWDRRFKFSVVRHPIDRFASDVLWSVIVRTRFGKDYGEVVDDSELSLLNQDFNRRMRGLIERGTFVERMRMYDRLCVAGEMGMDFVGRYENLAEDFQRIESRLHGVQPLPVLKKIDASVKDKYTIDHDVFELLTSAFARDFETFQYDPADTKYPVGKRQV